MLGLISLEDYKIKLEKTNKLVESPKRFFF